MKTNNVKAFSKTLIVNYATKLWTMFAGLVSIWFIAHYATPAEQGLYYTINSILALQIFIELGFNYAVVRIIGHKYGQIVGEATKKFSIVISHSEISTLCARFLRQSIVISTVAVFVLTPVGLFYFARLSGESVSWQLWIPLVVLTALNIALNTILSIIEGVGFISEVAFIRLWQATTLGVFLWISLWIGEKLYSILWANCASFFLVFILVNKKFPELIVHAYRARKSKLEISERIAIRRYIKKIAISGVSGYLIFQIFTPLITFYSGPVDAGKFAMTLQIITSLNIFGLVPLTSSAPRLGQLIGNGDVNGAKILFKKILYSSTGLMLFACVAFGGVLIFAKSLNLDLVERVMPVRFFLLMLAAAMANHLVFSIATYLRSFLDDPFWMLSIISATFVSFGAYFCVKRWGFDGAVYIYFINCVFIGLSGSAFIYMKNKYV